jgi:hypothetical protein
VLCYWIQPLLGAEDGFRLPASSVDLAIMVDVNHELLFPCEVLASIIQALKPGGQLDSGLPVPLIIDGRSLNGVPRMFNAGWTPPLID